MPLRQGVAPFLAPNSILEPSGFRRQEMSRLEEGEYQVNRQQGGDDQSGSHGESRLYETGRDSNSAFTEDRVSTIRENTPSAVPKGKNRQLSAATTTQNV
jgi:hypothetical protein